MKRFLVFECYTYYPSGGLSDLVYQSDSFEDIVDGVENGNFEQDGDYLEIQLLDTESGAYYAMVDGFWKIRGNLSDGKRPDFYDKEGE